MGVINELPLLKKGNLITYKKQIMKFPVTLYQDEDGWYVVECPTIPGCISQGETQEEALLNIQEAIQLCQEVRKEKGLSLTTEYFEVEVSVNA